ncbi:hypothetical protein BHE90_007167 [Fusarium euwallaceae]|uniref:Uncharacterized protein n=1 Tax=Fusarium euwallaceae TaxID=1147111 RepID=A0A430LRK5_9HYPO|nr:hypothetical protein BHE90_007167 [Fusarium euwallaceae]
MASSPRRSRKHRAAAPTKFADPGSDDEFFPEPSQRSSVPKNASASKIAAATVNLTHSSSSDDIPLMFSKKARAAKAAAARRVAREDEDAGYESSGSNSSIPAVSPKNTASLVEQASPAAKRGAPSEQHIDSPAKKPRIVLKRSNRSSDGASISPSPKSPTDGPASASKEVTPATSLAHSQPPLTTTPHETATLQPAALNLAEAARLQHLSDVLAHIRDDADAVQRRVQGALDAEAMQAKITALEAQLATLRAQGGGGGGDFSEYQKALDASQARERQLSASFETLKVEYQSLRVYTDELRVMLSNLDDELKKSSGEPDSSYVKVTDDEIGSKWLQLAHEIQNFTLQVLTRDPRGVTAPPRTNTVLVNALRQKRKQDPELVNFHFQKHIWDRINSEIFHGGSDLWGGRSGKSFNRLCIDATKGDPDEMKNLSPMKAQVAKLLRATYDDGNKSQVAKLVNDLKAELFVFTDQEMTKDVEKAKAVERRLKKIIDRAMRLNMIFMTSKAFFLPMSVQDQYDDDNVDIRFTRGNPGEETELELQVSPQIAKFGDADGYNFDSCIMVCKAIVTMCEVKPRGGKRG